ncbi:MAG: hypothetical protein LBS91_05465, partial [Clostridiales Family XIII bacterium]|nr:hypothetical protein [Clostridiales Family XIII bacterium]
AHADRDGLLDWVRGFDTPPSALFLVHGEAESKQAFAETLRAEANLDAIVIGGYCTYTYEPDGKLRGGKAAGSMGAPQSESVRNDIDPEEAERLLAKLRGIEDNMDGLIYRARLAAVKAVDGGDAESYTALKNIVASLESDTSKLAGSLAGRNE